MSPRRPAYYYLLEPLAIAFAFMAGALLMVRSLSKKAAGGSGAKPLNGSGNGLLKVYWPLLAAGAGGLAIFAVALAAPEFTAVVFPIAVLSALAAGVAISIRRSVSRK